MATITVNHSMFFSALFMACALALATACGGQPVTRATPTGALGGPALEPVGAPALGSQAPTPDLQATVPVPTVEPAQTATAELTPSPSAVALTPPPPAATLAVTATKVATSTGTSVPGSACTDAGTFVADVTIPDKTAVTPGQTFIKTWRLRNIGTCTWSAGYVLVFVRGQNMATGANVSVPQTAPHATVDLAVPMTAPSTPGTFQGFWELRGPKGVRFGPEVWALVEVKGASAATPSPAMSAAPSPGVFATRMQVDPAQPTFGEPVGFRLALSNTTGGSQTLRWFVKLYQCTETPCTEDRLKSSLGNLDRSFGESTIVESTLPSGTSEVAVPAHWVPGPGACVYTAVPHYFDQAVQSIVPFLKPDGVPLYHTFDICQTAGQ